MKRQAYIILALAAAGFLGGCAASPHLPAGATVRVGREGADFTTLREALAQAPDNVVLVLMDAGVFVESGLVVERDIVIRGAGMAESVIQGAAEPGEAPDRVFVIAADARVGLEQLTIENGVATEIPRRGGGVLNLGELRMDSCLIQHNAAVYGVGLDNRGIAVISRSEFRGNHSLPMNTEERTTGVGCTGSGGAIKNEPGGTLSVSGSIFAGNMAQAKGGAISVACESRATIHACTIEDNEAKDAGGGIYLRGDLVLTDSRITGNTSREGGGGVHVRGFLDYSGNVIRGNNRVDLIVGTGTSGIYGDGIIGIDEQNRLSRAWKAGR